MEGYGDEEESNQDLEKAGFLQVPDRVKLLILGHVFRIKEKTCPQYISTNFQQVNKNENRITTNTLGWNGFKKIFELKRRILFSFVDHTSVIKKNFKTEKLNGGFLRKLKKSPKKWHFFIF